MVKEMLNLCYKMLHLDYIFVDVTALVRPSCPSKELQVRQMNASWAQAGS